MKEDFNIQLLVSYLTGNCSKEEQKLVEGWLSESPENKVTLEEYRTVWASSGLNDSACLINIDRAWDDFKSKTNFDQVEEVETKRFIPAYKKSSIIYKAASIAAMFLLAISMVFVLNSEKKSQMLNYTSTATSYQNPLILSDGTKITFNDQSSLNYPENFEGKLRKVEFHGEAFFNVKSNPEKPMIIATDNVRVKILGTSFNLCNDDNSNVISVHLEEGKVLFYSVDDSENILQQIILLPGEVGVYNKKTATITKNQFTNSNYKSWETGTLDFVNAPLNEVIKTLERTYNIEVIVNTPVESYFLTAHYSNKSPKSIFNSFEMIFGLKIDQKNGKITISK